jgi:hypothetical protein
MMTKGIPDREFIEIFDRVSKVVHFGKCTNPKEVKRRIKHVLDMQRQAYRTAKRSSTAKKFRGDYNKLRTLYKHDLHERIWDEAVKDPGGIVDLTLDYGYERAQKIKLERERRRRGKLRGIR